MVLRVTEPVAPNEIWMPFCAMAGVAPAPVTMTLPISADEPGPSIVMPFFWYVSMVSSRRVAWPTWLVSEFPTSTPTPP
jgi:hypothetical protein